jgi:hypothetical protein
MSFEAAVTMGPSDVAPDVEEGPEVFAPLDVEVPVEGDDSGPSVDGADCTGMLVLEGTPVVVVTLEEVLVAGSCPRVHPLTSAACARATPARAKTLRVAVAVVMLFIPCPIIQ